MRVALLVLLAGAFACGAAGAPFLSGGTPPVPPRSGDGAGYYYWDSQETGEWAPVYEWFEPLEARGWRDDDACWTTATPFDIRFCGEVFPAGSTFYVGSNGVVGFVGDDMDDPINQAVPDAVRPNCLIAPLWDNLAGYADGDVYLDVDGTAPERRWYITYSPWHFYNSGIDPIEFQVVVFETELTSVNNTVEFHYRDVEGDSWRDNGASATVGLENRAGADAGRYSFDQPVIPNEFAVRFVDELFVDDQIGEFHLLAPPDGSEVRPGEIVHFTWQRAQYMGHGYLYYRLYLAENPDFEDPMVFETGGDTGMDCIFGTGDIGEHWWKVLAVESDIGLERWSEEVFSFFVAPVDVYMTSWGFIKAAF
jgi:hypothetical protein